MTHEINVYNGITEDTDGSKTGNLIAVVEGSTFSADAQGALQVFDATGQRVAIFAAGSWDTAMSDTVNSAPSDTVTLPKDARIAVGGKTYRLADLARGK